MENRIFLVMAIFVLSGSVTENENQCAERNLVCEREIGCYPHSLGCRCSDACGSLDSGSGFDWDFETPTYSSSSSVRRSHGTIRSTFRHRQSPPKGHHEEPFGPTRQYQ